MVVSLLLDSALDLDVIGKYFYSRILGVSCIVHTWKERDGSKYQA